MSAVCSQLAFLELWNKGQEGGGWPHGEGNAAESIDAVTVSVFPGAGPIFIQILGLANPRLGEIKVVLPLICNIL